MARPLKNLLPLLILVLQIGCAITPEPLTRNEIREQAQADRKELSADQEPVSGPVTLYEAMARALSYNLDLRLELLKKTLATRKLDVARYEQLPQLVGNLGYDSRSNFSGASSRSLVSGIESLESSTSSDRDLLSANLNLSWNILDFGVSYFRAQQAADQVLISEEQKRKVISRILRDVRVAYYKAVTAERLLGRLDELLDRVNQALAESQQIVEKRLDTPITALQYQRELIEIKRKLQELYKNLGVAKIELASLMNLPLGTKYNLDKDQFASELPELDISPEQLEQIALENRSEIRKVSYEKRINANEAKAAILELLPGVKLFSGAYYDSNSFLFNNSWLNYGAQISWNLLNLIKYPSLKSETEAREDVLNAQRLALSMAVLTQVHVGIAQYENAYDYYDTTKEHHEVQEKILEHTRSAATTRSINEQFLIREEMNTLLSDVRYDIAYADLQYSYANIYSALGINIRPEDIDFSNLQSITTSIREYFVSLNLENTISNQDVMQ